MGKVRVASSKSHIITLYGKPEEVTARGSGGAPTFVTFTYPKGKEKAHWFEFDRGGRDGKERFEWVAAMDGEVCDPSNFIYTICKEVTSPSVASTQSW